MKVLAYIALLGMTAGTSCGRAMEKTAEITVEADVFSGRPNPKWILNDSEAREFNRKLAELKPAGDSAEPPPDSLGYRGMIVRISGDSPEAIRLLRGAASYKKQKWNDTDSALEKWTISTGKGKVDDGLLEIVSRESAR